MGVERTADAAVAIFDQLCREAVWDEGRALWLGDERRQVDGRPRVIHTTCDGSLYGGSAGIALSFTRAFEHVGDERYRHTAVGALAHATRWLDRERPPTTLYSGTLGVVLALAEAGHVFGDETLVADAAIRAEDASAAPPPESADVIAGVAGGIVAWLALARLLGDERYVDVARRWGDLLVSNAEPMWLGAAWREPTAGDEPPLCGLAHGASGCAWALAELWLVTGDASYLRLADEAMRYERSWFDRDASNWPDLRETSRATYRADQQLATPVFWCHGGVGIGLTRLRHVELTGSTLSAAEAQAALVAADREVGLVQDALTIPDLSICHGLSGSVELLLESARVFGHAALAERAAEVAASMVDLGGGGAGPWPCGVSHGGENPSLMLGLAGIAALLLRVAARAPAPLGLPYTPPIATNRLIVKLAGALDQDQVQARLAELSRVVDGGRIERVSRSGRVVIRLDPNARADAAVAAAQQLDGVEYAELDVVDRAVDDA